MQASGAAQPQTPPKVPQTDHPDKYKKASRGMSRFDLVSHGDTLTGEDVDGIELKGS